MPTEGPQRRDGSPSQEESDNPDGPAANGSAATGSDEHPAEPHAWPEVELDPDQVDVSESSAREQQSAEDGSAPDGRSSSDDGAAPEVERTGEIRLAPGTSTDGTAESTPAAERDPDATESTDATESAEPAETPKTADPVAQDAEPAEPQTRDSAAGAPEAGAPAAGTPETGSAAAGRAAAGRAAAGTPDAAIVDAGVADTEDPEGVAAEDKTTGEAESAQGVDGAEARAAGADDAAGSETATTIAEQSPAETTATIAEQSPAETTTTIPAAQSPAETTATIPTGDLAGETIRTMEIPAPTTNATPTTAIPAATVIPAGTTSTEATADATATSATAGTSATSTTSTTNSTNAASDTQTTQDTATTQDATATEATNVTPVTGATEATANTAATAAAGSGETTEIRPAPAVESPTDTQPAARSDVESSPDTEVFGAVAVDAAGEGPSPAGAEPAGTDGSATPPGWSRQRRVTVVAAAVLGVLAALYGLDLLVSSGEIPRDVSVAGIDVAGMSHAAAERELRSRIEPRLREPAQVTAGDVRGAVDPAAAKVAVDWEATVRRAGEQPLNPWSRLTSFFVDRPVEPVVTGDERAIGAQLAPIGAQVDRKVTEGSIRFEGARPIPVKPVPGRRLEMDRAVPAVLSGWVRGGRIELPVSTVPVRSTEQDVRQAMERIAKPAVSGPVDLRGKGDNATLTPEAIGAALRFEPADGSGLRASLDPRALAASAGGALGGTERPSRDARITFPGKKPVVQPSMNGRKVDWGGMAKNLMPVLERTDKRALNVPYTSEAPKLTTEQLKNLGIKEVIGEFTTEDFASDSGINIRRVAEEVNGAIVRPGETFSLNGHTGPRGLEQGYIAAGVIKEGEASRAVGGGISQFATTMYNAAYFAAMKDIEHKEHSYYISRYPMAREATVFQNPDGSSVIDLKWKNEYPTGVAVQTVWTPSSITVRLWGTKRYNVKSVTGEPFGYTAAPTITKTPGESCTPTSGSSGFSATDTQIVRDLDGNEVRRNTRTVRYNGHPQIVCPKPPEEDKEKDKEKPKPDEKPRR